MTIHSNRFRPDAIRLEKHDQSQNIARFYVLRIQKSLFGEWALQRCWGRVGTQGADNFLWFDSEEQAQDALLRLEGLKKRRGYNVLPVQLKLF